MNQSKKTFTASNLMLFFLLALPLSACSGLKPGSTRVEEISFESGPFKLVGDLRLPAGKGPFPVVIFVHGSGSAIRTEYVYLPIMERMLQAGFATFAWDKPGSGESTGTLQDRSLQRQRAQIVLDAIETLKDRRDIDPQRIGLWGISQAGYVIPRVLTQTRDVAFVICISCAGESGVDQMAFQITALALCDGVSAEETDQVAQLLSELKQTQTYETYAGYLHYRETIKALAEIGSANIDIWSVLSEKTWSQNDPTHENTWNPIGVIRQTSVPILAIFGDLDRQLDPLQGAHAYQVALAEAGNPRSRVEVFPGANHGIVLGETGCPSDMQLMEQYAISLGYASLEEAMGVANNDPYKSGLFSTFPFAPGYLDLIEEWLMGFQP